MRNLLIFTLLFSQSIFAQESDQSKVVKSFKQKVGIFYFTGDTAKMEDTYVGSTTGSMDLKFETGLGVSYDYIFIDSSSRWDWSVGGFYDLPKKFKTSSMTLGGTDYTFSPHGTPRMSILGVTGNLIYKVDDKFSVPFGLNISRPILSGEQDNAKAAGGVGIQVGFAYQIEDKISVDFEFRSTYLTGNQQSDSGLLNYGTGTLSGFKIGAKYDF